MCCHISLLHIKFCLALRGGHFSTVLKSLIPYCLEASALCVSNLFFYSLGIFIPLHNYESFLYIYICIYIYLCIIHRKLIFSKKTRKNITPHINTVLYILIFTYSAVRYWLFWNKCLNYSLFSPPSLPPSLCLFAWVFPFTLRGGQELAFLMGSALGLVWRGRRLKWWVWVKQGMVSIVLIYTETFIYVSVTVRH